MSGSTSALGALLRDVSDALFDPRCAGGDHALERAAGTACAACLEALDAEGAGERCPSCSAFAGSALPCAACTIRPRALRVVAPRPHRGVARSLVLALKAARREDAARPLARATFADPDVSAALSSCDVAVPVPAHPVRRRERGFDPAEAIARELCRLARSVRATALPLRQPLRRRATEGKQSARTAQARRQALRGTLRTRWPQRLAIRGKRVALVDDVVTTGATASEAARLLLRAGALSVVLVACTRAEGALMDAPVRRRRSHA